ncbi:MAG: UdgX family uracil-DNA binding protein, partial [Variovorax sp.]
IDAPATTPARRIAPAAPRGVEHAIEEPAMSASRLKLSPDPAKALAQLKAATDRCRECPIGEHATQSVFGEGPVNAVLMVVGEQPGDQEDLRGHPFVGPAGKLFDRACADLGWPRDMIWVSNAVKHFKFELRGKRRIHKTPSQQEAAACLHWLESEIAQVRPQALVALGATAARALLGRPVAVMKERGQWHEGPRGERVLVTLHPSALLRGDPSQQDEAYAAWLADLSLASELATRQHRG